MNGLWWFLGLLLPLVFLQRSLHRQIQAVLLLVTRRSDLSIILFSILFFPGVLLHEASHYAMALLLRVRTGRFSLIPKPLAGGRLQLGYVETVPSDPVRDALIGAAPMLSGGLFVAYAGAVGLGLSAFWQSLMNGLAADGGSDGPSLLLSGLATLPERPDFWLWFYLTFVVSSTMFPSSSDRRGWAPLAILAALLFVLGLFAGAGPWLAANVAPFFDRVLEAAAAVLAISITVHLVLLPPFWLLRRLVSRLTGLNIA